MRPSASGNRAKHHHGIDREDRVHAAQQFFDAFARKSRDQHRSAVCPCAHRVRVDERCSLLLGEPVHFVEDAKPRAIRYAKVI